MDKDQTLLEFIDNDIKHYKEILICNKDDEDIQTYYKHRIDYLNKIKENLTIYNATKIKPHQPFKEEEQNYTLEGCKKLWKELGYKWKEDEIFITLIKQKYDKSIKINKKLKDYKCYDLFMTPTLLHTNNIALYITFQEHQLITKTLKALEVENAKNKKD